MKKYHVPSVALLAASKALLITTYGTSNSRLHNVDELADNMKRNSMKELLEQVAVTKDITPKNVMCILDQDGDGGLQYDELVKRLLHLIGNDVF